MAVTDRTNSDKRSGAVSALVAVSLLGLLAVLALAIDGGAIQRERRTAQTAADAGALAGAIEIFRSRTDSVAFAATNEAARNGYTHGAGGVLVTPTYPSTSTAFPGAKFVGVVVEKRVQTLLAGMFGQNVVTVHGRATAGMVLAEVCFIVLDPGGADALKLSNSAKLTGSGCGVQVNSTSPTGLNAAGTQTLVTAPVIGVGGSSVGGTSDKFVTPGGVDYGVPPAVNPLAYMTMPTIPNTCDYGSTSSALSISGNTTLTPGTYCGGLNITSTVTLGSGLYILRGGGLSVSGSGTLRSAGTGVTILNTAPPASASYPWGPISLQGGSVTVDLRGNTDPASALPGVLFYSDPAAPMLNNIFKANASTRVDGTMYFPSQKVSFQSGSNLTINGALVAYQVDLSQSGAVTFTGYGGGSNLFALRRPTVVE
ncbi:MAG TPA: pilus assembly protein TadG-related protein [Gemmatimonadaceae bacterium]|nr:pilus assembly protein TadG-related protein [Gemmatimonadaceae bacterium]